MKRKLFLASLSIFLSLNEMSKWGVDSLSGVSPSSEATILHPRVRCGRRDKQAKEGSSDRFSSPGSITTLRKKKDAAHLR